MSNDLAGIIGWISSGQKLHDPFLWSCPFCSKGATVTAANREHESIPLPPHKSADAEQVSVAISVFVVCPNPKCGRYSLYVLLYPSVEEKGRERGRPSLRNCLKRV